MENLHNMENLREKLTRIAKQLRKADWPKSEELEKGSFTKWCKDHGHSGPGLACAKHAWKVANKNNNKELRGKVSFYMNTVKPGGKDASALDGDKKDKD